jgi:exopolysaccharide biosynthesis polyprenyl glycosylphosphotransferase
MKRIKLFFVFIQVPLDLAMIVLAFVLAYVFRASIEFSPLSASTTLSDYLQLAVIVAPVWIVLNAINDLYAFRRPTGFAVEFWRIIIAASTAILFLIVVIFLSKILFVSRLILIFTWLFGIFTIFAGRILLRIIRLYLYRYDFGRINVLLIGNNEITLEVANEIVHNPSYGHKLVGTVAESGENATGLKVVGELDSLPALIKKFKIDEIILTDSSINKDKMLNILEICQDNRVAFKYVPDLFSLMTTSFKPGLIGSLPVMELESIPLDGWGRIIKRIFDIIFSFALIVVLSPIGLLIALLIKLTSKGPVFYTHQRIGRDEKEFKFYKFRSLYVRAKLDTGTHWTTQDEEKNNATLAGKLLRKTNLDELPQLWNILIGDMSFVGPRPEQPKLVEKFEKEIPEYFRRHRVKTGLTGWAQVNGLKGDTSIKERIKYDIYYIENWSMWMDIKIIIKTVWLVIYEAFAGKYEYRTRP